jgi:exosortase
MYARLLVMGSATVAAWAVWPSLQSLAGVWRDVHDYQHGWLIALISVAWFGVVLRRGLPEAPRPSLTGGALLAATLFAWLVCYNANSQMAHEVLAPAVIWLAILAAAGWRVALAFAAPVGFLYFATPIWEYAVPVLQRLSVWATESLLGLAGVPVTVREYVVTIPEGTFRIIEGCSGKRYFMVTLAMAVLSAAVNGIRGWRYPVFIGACGLLAMLANYLRIVIVIVAGHLTDMQHYLVAVEHRTLGNVIFVLLLAVVFLLARVLSPANEEAPRVARNAGDAVQGPMAGRVAVFAVLALAIGLVHVRSNAAMPAPALGPLPLVTADWQGPLPPDPAWAPVFPGASDVRRAAYASPAGTVELYVNVYGEQRQGEGELVYFANRLLAPGDWKRPWPVQTTPLGSSAGRDLPAFEAAAADRQDWIIARIYDVGGQLRASELGAQLSYGVLSTFRPVPAGVFAMAARCNGNCEAARALVKSFWDDMSVSVRSVRQDGQPPIGD